MFSYNLKESRNYQIHLEVTSPQKTDFYNEAALDV